MICITGLHTVTTYWTTYREFDLLIKTALFRATKNFQDGEAKVQLSDL